MTRALFIAATASALAAFLSLLPFYRGSKLEAPLPLAPADPSAAIVVPGDTQATVDPVLAGSSEAEPHRVAVSQTTPNQTEDRGRNLFPDITDDDLVMSYELSSQTLSIHARETGELLYTFEVAPEVMKANYGTEWDTSNG